MGKIGRHVEWAPRLKIVLYLARLELQSQPLREAPGWSVGRAIEIVGAKKSVECIAENTNGCSELVRRTARSV